MDLSEVIAAQINGEDTVASETVETAAAVETTETEAVVEEAPIEETPKKETAKVELDEETAKAVALFRVLNDPSTAKDTARRLAEGLGFKIQDIETAEEAAEVVDEIEKAILDDLGDDYPELSQKLSKALKKAINLGVEKGVKDLKAAEETREIERVRQNVDNAFNTYHSSLDEIEKKEFDALIPQMTELGKKVPVGEMTPGEYLDVLFAAAKRTTIKPGAKNAAPIKSDVVPAKRPAPDVEEGDIDEVMAAVIREEIALQRKGS